MAQGLLYATTIQGCAGAACAAQTTMTIGKQQFWIAVGLPESAQDRKGGIRQGDKAVAVAFGVPNMHALAICVDVGQFQVQAFAQAQTHAVQGEVKHPVTQYTGVGEKGLRLLNGDDVRQARDFGWFDEVGHDPGFAQHVLGVELEAIQVELDGAPRVRFDQVAEVVGELCR